jgi:hypothetical protein
MSFPKFIVAVIFLLLTGCGTKSKDSMDIPMVDLFAESNLVESINDYIDGIEVISLSSQDSLILFNVTKMLMTDTKEMILLSGAGIYKYDSKGRLSTQFGRIGRGHGEYMKIYDICINKAQTELWCLNHLNEVMKYDLLSGKYIETIDTQSPKNGIPNASGIAPAVDGGFYLFVPNPEDVSNIKDDFLCLYLFNTKGKLINKSMLRKDFNVDFGFIPFITQSCGNVYFIRPQENENICYEITDGEIQQLMEINFGKNNIPPLYSFRNNLDPWVNLEELMNSNYYKMPFNIFANKSHIAVSAFGPDSNIYNFIISSNKKGGINWSNGVNNLTTPLMIIGCDEDNYFYILFDKYELEDSDKLDNIDPLLRYLVKDQNIYLSANDNPKIIKVRFKPLT